MGEGRILKVRACPRSANTRVEELGDDTYKVHVTCAPEKGRANAAVVKALSRHLGVCRSALELVSGGSSRDKLFRLEEEK